MKDEMKMKCDICNKELEEGEATVTISSGKYTTNAIIEQIPSVVYCGLCKYELVNKLGKLHKVIETLVDEGDKK